VTGEDGDNGSFNGACLRRVHCGNVGDAGFTCICLHLESEFQLVEVEAGITSQVGQGQMVYLCFHLRASELTLQDC
jgi:hypothetical protein